MSGCVNDTYVTRLGFHADKDLHVMRRMQDTFQQLEHQAELDITSVEG